jgi:SAM-dependent methyltransferase
MPNDSCDNDDDDDVVEEIWMTADGANVFSLEPEFVTNEIRFVSQKNIRLKYKSFTEHMTPLDVLYGKHNDEFYDGTGNLVWLAALGFGYLLDENCGKIRNYLGPQICELGCGTGVAGIAALLYSSNDSDSSSSSHVLFTDNDAESLELCRTNCELNDLEETTQYSRHILSWGQEPYPVSNVDTILATDVLYDMVMIPPLMKTAATLLKHDGYALLSHVPRFCLPKREQEQEEDENCIVRDKESFQAYRDLEVHILDQAKQVGLVLVDTIRLHQVLKTLPSTKQEASLSSPPHLSLEQLEDMHAVLFVFQKKQEIT